MKLRVKHSLACLLAAILVSSMITGCVRTTATSDYSTTIVAKLGSENIYLDEAAYMARAVQYSYEAVFASDIWSYDYTGNGDTMESMVKESVMQQIYQTKVLVAYAKANGIELTDKQKTLVADTVAEIMEDSAYAEAVGATEELLMDIYTENAIANLVYLKLTEDTDIDINEEDYLHKSYDYIKVAEDEEDETDEESIVEDILKAMEAGEELADIVSSYEDSAYTVTNSSNSFMLSEDVAYGEFAWNLTEGECGSTYVEGDAWYILKCTSEKDEDATQTAINDEIESRKDANFEAKYADIKEKADKFSVDEDVWALINFDEAVYVAESTADAEGAESTGDTSTATEPEEETDSTTDTNTEAEDDTGSVAE